MDLPFAPRRLYGECAPRKVALSSRAHSSNVIPNADVYVQATYVFSPPEGGGTRSARGAMRAGAAEAPSMRQSSSIAPWPALVNWRKGFAVRFSRALLSESTSNSSGSSRIDVAMERADSFASYCQASAPQGAAALHWICCATTSKRPSAMSAMLTSVICVTCSESSASWPVPNTRGQSLVRGPLHGSVGSVNLPTRGITDRKHHA